MSKQAYEEKRIKTFMSLHTVNTQWKHAKVETFQRIERTNRSGKLIEQWVPVYKIPEGFTNPFQNDVLVSKTKRCQLCDHNIVNYGIILHEEKKYFLVVGTECYEIYEGDDDRRLRLELLAQMQADFIAEKVKEERTKIESLLAAYEADPANREGSGYYTSNLSKLGVNSYNVYLAVSTIRRQQWRNWSKTKVINFIVKNAPIFKAIGWNVAEFQLLNGRNVQKYWQSIACANLRLAYHAIAQKREFYYHTAVHVKTGKTLPEFYKELKTKLTTKTIPELEEIANTNLVQVFESYEWTTQR